MTERREENSGMSSNQNEKVSSMINPDGSVTIRRKKIHADGTSTFIEQELPCIENSDVPTLQLSESDSISSITDQRTYKKIDGGGSVASSKEDVFAGIESDESLLESPPRPPRPPNPVPFELSGKENLIETNGPMPIGVKRDLTSFKKVSGISQLPRTSVNQRDAYNWNYNKLHGDSPLVNGPIDDIQEELPQFTVTVFKKSQSDRIGINLCMQRFSTGNSLVVAKIATNGLFAGSPIEKGDRVLSINNCPFHKNPEPAKALDIVRQATGKITFVLQKRPHDTTPIQNLPLGKDVMLSTGSEMGRAITREIWNEDGSLTVIVDHFDEKGVKIRREIRRKRINADNGKILDSSGSYSSSGSIHVERQMEDTKEKKLVVRRASKAQHIGLTVMTLNTPKGLSLFVADVPSSGLIAQAQLSLKRGDEILKINGFNFQEDPNLEIANSIIENSIGDLTIIARGAEHYFGDFSLLENESIGNEEANSITTTSDKSKSFDFDENSYGGSIGTIGSYVSSNIVKITKNDPKDALGISIATKNTEWGPLLVVSGILPSSKLAKSELSVGDAILAINGTSFRENPNVARASSIFQQATNIIIIEYQRLSHLKAAISWAKQQEKVNKAEKAERRQKIDNFGADIQQKKQNKTERTTRIQKLEDFDAGIPVRTSPLKNDKSSLTVSPEGSPVRHSHNLSYSSDASQATQKLTPQLVPSKSDTVIVRVTKKYPGQEVGIDVECIDGILYVSKLSLRGLLVGKNILPGDIILSINNKSFRKNPSVKEAYSQIQNGRKILVFEVKKQNGLPAKAREQNLKWHERLSCSRKNEFD